MSITLRRRDRLLRVRTILAKRNGLSSTPLISSRFPTTTKRKDDPTGTVTGRSQANSLKKKCKKKFYLGIHDRIIRDERFRKNMFDTVRTEKMCRKMDELANETHTHHLTPDEIRGYRANSWIRSNKADPIRCQSGIVLTSSKHCQPCDSSKTKRMQLISKDGRKAIPYLVGTGKNPGGILFMNITTKTYPALIDPGKPDEK